MYGKDRFSRVLTGIVNRRETWVYVTSRVRWTITNLPFHTRTAVRGPGNVLDFPMRLLYIG